MENSEKQAPAAGASVEDNGAPTGERRLALVRTLQSEAARRPDPLAANLGVLAGDLFGFAHLLAPAVQAELAGGSTAPQAQDRSRRGLDMILRLVRQAERCARVEGPAPPPATEAQR